MHTAPGPENKAAIKKILKKHWQNITWSPAYAERAPIIITIRPLLDSATEDRFVR